MQLTSRGPSVLLGTQRLLKLAGRGLLLRAGGLHFPRKRSGPTIYAAS